MMKDILYVDGYNIIHSWQELRDLVRSVNLQAARERLADIVGEYAVFMGMNAEIVFDAYMVKGTFDVIVNHPGVIVHYTKEHQTADSYIEKSVAKLDRYQQNIYVATSDSAEQLMVLSHGANRIPARELYNLIKKKTNERTRMQKNDSSAQLSAYLDDEMQKKLRKIAKDN